MLMSAGLPVSANAINKDVGVHTEVCLNVRHRVVSPARIAERTASPEIRLKLYHTSGLRGSHQHLIAEAPLVVGITGWVQRDQQAAIVYLLEENRVLKARLRGRKLRLTDDERHRLAVKGKALGRKLLAEVVGIVTPETNRLPSCAKTRTATTSPSAGLRPFGMSQTQTLSC